MIKQKDGPPSSGTNAPPNELFEWVESPAAALKSRNSLSLTSPLRALKTIIWSIEWEISDKILLMLTEELNQLKQYYQEDTTVLNFLQLMEALGKYIKKRKGKSHPESINLLRVFFIELERIVFMMGMSEGERKACLNKQIQKFNLLKKKLAAVRTAEESRESPAPEKKPPEVRQIPANTEKQVLPAFNHEIFRQMLLDEIKALIREEFGEIKAELKEMGKNQRFGNKD